MKYFSLILYLIRLKAFEMYIINRQNAENHKYYYL